MRAEYSFCAGFSNSTFTTLTGPCDVGIWFTTSR